MSDDPYKAALECARSDYHEKLAERERLLAECDALDLRLRRLGSVIVALSDLLDLPCPSEALEVLSFDRRKKRFKRKI